MVVPMFPENIKNHKEQTPFGGREQYTRMLTMNTDTTVLMNINIGDELPLPLKKSTYTL